MSHEIVKRISIKQNKVYLTSADSSLRPLHFSRWECESLSKILAEEGRSTLLARIGQEVWNGNIHLRKGSSKLCDLFLTARDTLPRSLSWSNYDSKTAGEYLARMVTKLEKDPHADLSSDVKEMLALMDDRDYILEAAHRTGHNFLNFASEALQHDRELALEVLCAGDGRAWFEYPAQFKGDKEFALEAVKLNGCMYRYLDDSLKADREIIFSSFQELPGREFHEHMPNLIPVEAYCSVVDGKTISIDRDFICRLLDMCPSMHLDRAPLLLNDREIALHWCQVGAFFPFSTGDLPTEFLHDEEFQNTLCARFEGTDKFDTLMQRFAVKGVLLAEPSLDGKIKAAKARQTVRQEAGFPVIDPER